MEDPNDEKAAYSLSESEAFSAMQRFLEQFVTRGGNDLLTLLGDIALDETGDTFDPAAWDDWIACVKSVIDERD